MPGVSLARATAGLPGVHFLMVTVMTLHQSLGAQLRKQSELCFEARARGLLGLRLPSVWLPSGARAVGGGALILVPTRPVLCPGLCFFASVCLRSLILCHTVTALHLLLPSRRCINPFCLPFAGGGIRALSRLATIVPRAQSAHGSTQRHVFQGWRKPRSPQAPQALEGEISQHQARAAISACIE